MSVLLFILVLSILVFVHELGHFWVARKSKIGVHEFGFGFPPKIWGITRGEVTYSINAIPFGGFVRLVGEGPGEENLPNSFLKAPIIRRLMVLLAGVFMNIVLAWVLLSATFTIGLRVTTDAAASLHHAKLQDQRIELYVSSDTAAAKAGLESGDTLISVDGQVLHSTEELITYTKNKKYPEITALVRRGQNAHQIHITPTTPNGSDHPVYGFGVQETGLLKYHWYDSPAIGARALWYFSAETVHGLGRFASDLFRHGRVADEVAGPVGIAILTSEVSRLGIAPLLQFMAVLSISLAMMNVLPLPALDGGRVLFTIIEAFRGKPVNPKWERTIHSLGFITLLLLIALISVRDVRRFDVIDRITGIFH